MSKNFSHEDVKVISQEVGYRGFFQLIRYEIAIPLYNGKTSHTLVRECMVRRPAVAVLAYDPIRDSILLIKQMRMGPFVAKYDSPWMIEIIAGVIEEGETPIEVAHRELQEESGCKALAFMPIYDYYPSPGASSERVHLFCAQVDASTHIEFCGIAHEGEDIHVLEVPSDEALQWLKENKINNGFTIIALQWFQLHKQFLQQQWCNSNDE